MRRDRHHRNSIQPVGFIGKSATQFRTAFVARRALPGVVAIIVACCFIAIASAQAANDPASDEDTQQLTEEAWWQKQPERTKAGHQSQSARQIQLIDGIGGQPATSGGLDDTREAAADPKSPAQKATTRSAAQIENEFDGLERIDVIPPSGQEFVIDLPTALRLAESSNPAIAISRTAISEALAIQSQARGILLPSLNAGTSYHFHQGVLQTSFGEIRQLNEQSLYIGGGARTLAAETIGIPMLQIFAHLGDAYFAPLSAAQVVTSRDFQSRAVRNDVLLQVVGRYLDLVAAETQLETIHRSEEDMRRVVATTASFARAGRGRIGDFNRAKTDALLLHSREQRGQEAIAVSSAELARVLHLDPSVRLKTHGGFIEVVQLIDPDYSVDQLVALAQAARPEVTARTADVNTADYRLRQEYARPWLPTVMVGYSTGFMGGGSNRTDLGVDSMWQRFIGRTDFDVYAFWTLQNLGFGNAAVQKERRAERDDAVAHRGLLLNRVAREVADAYARTQGEWQQLELARRRLETASLGATEELARIRGGIGLPLEAINSVNLLVEARDELIAALVGYDFAQFELFVAIGETPDAAAPDPLKAAPSPNGGLGIPQQPLVPPVP